MNALVRWVRALFGKNPIPKGRPDPAWSDWIAMTEAARVDYVASLNPYAGEGAALGRRVKREFETEYAKHRGLTCRGVGNVFGGAMLVVEHPFHFDRRILPQSFFGFLLRPSSAGPLPVEFTAPAESDYVWDYRRYERYVDRCLELIKADLGHPEYTRADVLDALCVGGFEAHKADCIRWAAERLENRVSAPLWQVDLNRALVAAGWPEILDGHFSSMEIARAAVTEDVVDAFANALEHPEGARFAFQLVTTHVLSEGAGMSRFRRLVPALRRQIENDPNHALFPSNRETYAEVLRRIEDA